MQHRQQRYKKHIACILTPVILFTITVSIMIYTVDPLQVFHDQLSETERISGNQRLANPGLIRRHIYSTGEFNSIIIGTSMTENFIPEEAAQLLGWSKTMSLATSGAYPGEQKQILEYALQSGQIKNVLWGIHTIFSKRSDWNINPQWSSTEYLYDKSLLNKSPYLFSIKMFKESYRILTGDSRWTTNISLRNLWSTEKKQAERAVELNSQKSIHNIEVQFQACKERTQNFSFDSAPKVGQFDAVDTVLLATIAKYPNTQFTLVLPPVSLYSRGLDWNETLRWLSMVRYIVQSTAQFNNVTIYGFDTVKDIVENIANYKDATHYQIGVNRFILHAIAQCQHKLTTATIDDYISTYVGMLRNYAPYSDQPYTIAYEGPFNPGLYCDKGYPPFGPLSPLAEHRSNDAPQGSISLNTQQ